MIVAGNSNVACLDQMGARLEVEGQPAEVCWVGALRFSHFFDGHPAGKRVRARFAASPGPRLLAIGTHDVFDVCDAAGRGTVDAQISQLMDHAEHLFAELGRLGSVAWLVFPQPQHAVRYAHLGPGDVHVVATKVNAHLAEVAARHGVAVIDPFGQLRGEDVDPTFIQRDGQHLNPEGAARLAAAIGRTFAVRAELARTRNGDFEPEDELASFCGMLLQAIGVRGDAAGGLQATLLSAVAGRLEEKGLPLEVTPELELVDAGLLDSLDLVDVYAHATRAAGLDIPFDVSLRELNTVAKMEAFIRGHLPPTSIPSRADFERSMAAARGQIPVDAADQALQNIAGMSEPLAKAIVDQLDVTLHGHRCPYGVVLLWLGLFTLAQGDVQGAAHLVESSGAVAHPVRRELVLRVMDAVEAATLAAAS